MRCALRVVPLLVLIGCQTGQAGSDSTLSTTPASAGSSGDTTAANADDVMLSVDKTDYSPGATVAMSITSHRADTLGYNPCSNRSFERDSAGRWVVHPEPNRMCTMELRLLMPHETQAANTAVPGDASPGSYRIVLRLQPQRTDAAGATTVTAVSPTFSVSAR